MGKQALVAIGFLLWAAAFAVPALQIGGRVSHEPLADAPERNRALIAAAALGDTDEVRRLLRQGASVHATDERGVTALLAAAYNNHPETMRALLSAGADINHQDNNRDNPYLYTAAEGHLEALRVALEAKPDLRRTNRYGGTGLIPA